VTARVAARPARILAPVLFIVLVYARGGDFGGPAWPALALILCGLLPLMPSPPARARSALAGTVMGLASLFQLEMAVGAVLGVCAHLVREQAKGRQASRFALAFLAPPALAFTFFSIAAGPVTVLEWGLIRPWRQRLAELRVDAGHPWGVPLASWIVLIAGGAACAALALRRGRTGGETGLRLCAWAGLGVLLAPTVAHIDAYTLAIQSSVLLPVLAAALVGGGRPRATPAWTARAAAAAVLAVGILHGAAFVAGWRQHNPVPVAQRFRAGTAWIGAPARDLEWIERNTAPGERIFAFPAAGMFYFLTGTRNATSFPAMVEGRWSEEEQRQALREIDAARPAIGVWLDAERFPVAPGAASLDTLYQGILRRYQAEAALPGGTLLLRRRPAAGP